MEKSAVRAMEKSLCYLRSIKGSGSPEDSLPSLDMSSNSGHGSVLEVDDFVSDGEVSMCVSRHQCLIGDFPFGAMIAD